MAIRLLKFIYHFFMRPMLWINLRAKKFFYFILPNITFIINGRIKSRKYPICNQITFLTGAGTIEIGMNCMFGFKLGGFHRGGSIEFQPRYKNSHINIGNNVSTNNNLFFCAANYIEIGDDTLIGQNVTITDHEAHGIPADKRRELGMVGEVLIGKNVWIGTNVTILKDSHIGDNSIVAAGAVVSGKFPDNVVIGGVPAKIIRNL
jgi:hypothetical protein